MTPGARVQAAIEVLDAALSGTPVEQALTNWARRSRFAGSGDRAAVRDHVFQAVRCRRSYAALGGALTGRGLMIGALRDAGEAAETVFDGTGYGPEPLCEAEQIPGALTGNDALDLPDWLIREVGASLGEAAERTALALRTRAPVMARVNLARTTPAEMVLTLAEQGIEATPDQIAASALRLGAGARRLAGSEAYRNGLIEIQDGSSQAAMALLDVPQGSRVLDYCAGGGGKTLALAGRVQAQWFVHDAQPQRMKDLPVRAARAGITVQLLEAHELVPQAPFDLVLCDAPCSGSGTWRRAPEAKWALTPERLTELAEIQRTILNDAAPLVAANGTLAYATCSLLRQENEAQIEGFLEAHPRWHCTAMHHWPVSDSGDGFFLAALRCDAARIMQA